MEKPKKSQIFNSMKTIEQYKSYPMFGGVEPALVDTIYKQYPKIWSLYKEMKSLDWDENEFDYSRCLVEFKTTPKYISDKMIKTIGWQWEADSVASRSFLAILMPFATSTEYWATLVRIADNECLTNQHDVYHQTKGWVNISEIVVGDMVLQYDPSTKGMSYVSVTHTTKKEYNDDIILFQSGVGTYKQYVTKKHRMVTNRSYGTHQGVEIHEALTCPTNGSMEFISSGLIVGDKKVLTPKERLWIAFQADGSYNSDAYNGRRTGTIPINFGFNKERKKIELESLIDETGYSYKKYELSQVDSHKYVVNIPIDEFIINGKDFGWVDLSNVDAEWCRSFIDEICKWDGCTRDTPIRNRHVTTYSSTSKTCVDVVATIASFAGYRCKINALDFEFPRKQCYQLSITAKSTVSGNTVSKEYIKHEGDVYCITVPSGAFLTRCEDTISVTGNCLHAFTYSEIVKLSFENPDEVIGQIMEFKATQKRLTVLTDTLENALTLSKQYWAGLIPFTDELYREVVLKTVICALFLERIQFMASFGITFTICSTGLFQPIGKAVQKICQDELEVHSEFDKAVLTYELNTERGRRCFDELKDWIVELGREIIGSEFAFIDGIHEDGVNLVGTTPELLKEWVLFNAKDVYRFLGIETTEFVFPKKNPMPLLEDWININSTQAAPQEQDVAAYKVGVVFDDSEDEIFEL